MSTAERTALLKTAPLVGGGGINGDGAAAIAHAGGGDGADLGTDGSMRRASAFRTAAVFTLATCSALICYTIRVLPSVAMQGPGGIASDLNWTNTDKGQGRAVQSLAVHLTMLKTVGNLGLRLFRMYS